MSELSVMEKVVTSRLMSMSHRWKCVLCAISLICRNRTLGGLPAPTDRFVHRVYVEVSAAVSDRRPEYTLTQVRYVLMSLSALRMIEMVDRGTRGYVVSRVPHLVLVARWLEDYFLPIDQAGEEAMLTKAVRGEYSEERREPVCCS